MSEIIKAFESKRSLLKGNGVSEEKIKDAEKQLGITFAPEYREYLQTYGIAAYDGHELTGITSSSRVNVVDVTLAERKKLDGKADNLYVIEETNYEGVVIWQAENGELFVSMQNKITMYMYSSLRGYILDKKDE